MLKLAAWLGGSMRILPVLLLLCATSSASAEIFKCTDKFGQARYQAKPCQESLNAKPLTLKSDTLRQREEKSRMYPQSPANKPEGVQEVQNQQGGMPPVQSIPAVSP